MSDKRHYVYTLAYPESMGGHVFYVGKGTRDRINAHEREARKGIKNHKCNVIRKIWANNSQITKTKLTFFETHQDACVYEIALIFFMDNLVNQTSGGDGTAGLRNAKTEDHRRKIGMAQKGKIVSKETRRRISESKSGKPVKPRSPESLKRLSDSLKASQRNQAQLQKLHDMQRGIPRTVEERRKMSEAKKGKPVHPNTLQRAAEANKQRAAQKREQASLAMITPAISSTDVTWKQGLIAPSLWEVTLL